MGELSKLINIGPVVEKQLEAVGIHTFTQLEEMGSREAWLRLKAYDPSACYNRLCGLEGALQNIRWHHLDKSVKAELKAFYEEFK